MNLDKEYIEALKELQEVLGVHFNDIMLVEEALVHSSYLNENPSFSLQSNERLEFLGDAVISFLIAERLFRDFSRLSEGDMTRVRSRLVCQENLSSLARQINLGKYLLLSRGENITGGRDRDSNLASAFEALIGAIYLDKGLMAVKDFLFRRVTTEEILALIESETFDFKSRLQEYIQPRYQLTPVYETIREEGPPHDKNFIVEVRVGEKVIGKGYGKSKKKAEEEAARHALDKLAKNQSLDS